MREKVDENVIFEMSPEQITVNKDLPRHRKDLGKIQKMMESIETFGQLQPIVINRKNELIAGGRRLAACTMLGVKARVCYKDTIDTLLMRELELEENLQRKNLTPAEECLAIEELVRLKQEKYGKPTQGKTGGFTLNDAAEVIGKSKGNVIEAIQISDMVKSFPDLSKAKTKSEIKKAYKGLQRIQNNIEALTKYDEKAKNKNYKIVNKDALEYMKTVEDNSVDLLFTDPPYGIDIFKNMISVGKKTGGDLTTTGTKYEDTFEYTEKLITQLATESFRFVKSNGHAYVFCGKDRFIFNLVYDIMTKAGWIVLKWPMIWIKSGSGQNNNPYMWPSSAYEAILFARKSESQITIPGKVDWIQCNPVTRGEKVHQAEKPVPLCKELISRVTMPGQMLCDPFCGSGAIIKAAEDMKLFSIGCDKSKENFASAIARLEGKDGKAE